MRIRSKLSALLLAAVLVPLCVLGWFDWRQATDLGLRLSADTAARLEAVAARELAHSAEMLAEGCSDALDLLETALSLMAGEAARLLEAPARHQDTPVLFGTDFDAGVVPPEKLVPLVDSDVPGSYEHLVFHTPPELPPAEALREARALQDMLPTMRTLFARHKDLMAFGYVGLSTGLHMAYPGHGGYPRDYDPRRRPWYRSAARERGITWSVMADAVTRQVMATMALAVTAPDGSLLGVAGLDIPMGALFLKSDPSRNVQGNMRTLVLSVKPGDLAGLPDPVVVASRDYAREAVDWKAPVELVRLTSPDREALAAVTHDLSQGRSGVRRLPVAGQDSLLAYAPVAGRELAVALLTPRGEVIAGALEAEALVLADVDRMAARMGWFVSAVALAVAGLALAVSRTATRPVQELARAARRLAAGDFEARAPERGRDELAELARAFNDMAPHLLERLKLKGDMALAMEVQQHLLPHRPPDIRGLDVAATSLYCDETGGDYFDFLEFAQEDAAHADIVVGDVTGHGMPAALFMASGRALLRGRAMGLPGPALLLTEVNRLLWQDTQLSGRFITLFFLRLDHKARELIWCRAGHDPAILHDPRAGTFEILMGSGIPLGVEPDWTYTEKRRPWLEPGQLLLLYTDGIHEAVNPDGAMYGRERLKAVLAANANAPASTVVNALMADLKVFKDGLPLEDDVTLVVVKATH
ncbi:Phosphoserine phosphatase RsbU [Fundidesulfovibrio magnetotacticus]|uniref:Phosphoserine phosphatase RsbU n=1 Tax=Fundidesulfovibrio magnetotacticus TaxID=2730080 RepID=A0A6V8LWD7_9BACT|nr:SpoIIE family protein phosphatase [Fundidesulfovibrio magnetotacticus]GFK94588.1 Phosphoserine phosphatase RsbU [Fundidesulfovibrio magnetotacticus]